MADAKSLNDLFVMNLRLAYDTEQRLVDKLPDLQQAANSVELKHALRNHLEETRNHVTRLEQIFESLGEKAKKETCNGIKGILDDGKDVVKLDAEPDVKDAAIIAAAQESEHLEIALYGTLRTWAGVIGDQRAADLLESTLTEEKSADELLTSIAATLNLRAANAR